MTREERIALREQRLQEALAKTRRERARLEAQQRAQERTEQARRRQRVGTLADQAGLLEWDDATLALLFQILAGLRTTTNPLAVLEALLSDPPDVLTETAAGAAPFLLASFQSDSSEVSG
jgi:hypothetical protein